MTRTTLNISPEMIESTRELLEAVAENDFGMFLATFDDAAALEVLEHAIQESAEWELGERVSFEREEIDGEDDLPGADWDAFFCGPLTGSATYHLEMSLVSPS